MRLISLRNISKHFGAVQAVDSLSLELEQGAVVGLMGDNGAGKSTLLKIISGNFAPSAGVLEVNGRREKFNDPRDARAAGIEAVYQDLALCDNLTVAENIFLGRERVRGWGPFRRLDSGGMEAQAAKMVARLKSEVSTNSLVSLLSGGQRQAVAIARTLLSHPKLVLLDEPTAAISLAQVKEVLALIRELREQGVAVLFISHRLPDILAVSDRIVVMRRGRKVGDRPAAETSPEEITGLITGAIDAAL
ncbi:MAG: ABC transporter ATP-binding protein [Proteobacteria bacterium]|nr:MAG: ABC transporter ATP-binding protein [Pseudomonadota bacterium]